MYCVLYHACLTYKLCTFRHVLCTNVVGVDDVFTTDSADDFAKVDQHTRPRNAASM